MLKSLQNSLLQKRFLIFFSCGCNEVYKLNNKWTLLEKIKQRNIVIEGESEGATIKLENEYLNHISINLLVITFNIL